jgi:uncharacterized protein (TIGR00730 family)
MNSLSSICVFCGANPGKRPIYVEAAVALGRELGRRGIDLVYGGGSVGLMGAVARAARDAGCRVTGIIPESLTTKELMGEKVGELIIVGSMHERKALMTQRSDAFIAIPGGFGTMDELFEAITWGQIGIHNKPIGLLNLDSYFDPLVQWIDHATQEGFIRPHHRDLIVVGTDPVHMIDQLVAYQAPPSLVPRLGLDQA